MSALKKILLVDDDHAVTDYLQLKLASHYQVVAVNDPRRVQALARSERPDLVVCDVDMPDMDGGEVRRALADDGQTRAIPFLYLTSIVSAEEVSELGGFIGGSPGVSKQAPIAEIIARIDSLLSA